MAGGCKDWCVEHIPTSSAEMYDPATNTWTQLPDLPMSISGGRMEQLNGKPTLIGGATPTYFSPHFDLDGNPRPVCENDERGKPILDQNCIPVCKSKEQFEKEMGLENQCIPIKPIGNLISYDPDTNEWYLNNEGEIKIPRSNHAVIQIPKYMVPSCFL